MKPLVRTKIAFLYSEVADYFLACAETLSQQADVLIVRWPTNAEAPFQFQPSDQLKVVVKTEVDLEKLTKTVFDFNPDIVVCSGWMDKDYLKIVKGLNKNVIKVLSLDNHWKASFKQRLASLISPFYLKRLFTHAWVPGTKQAEFAKKLGFANHTLKGFYCANTPLFETKYKTTFGAKRDNFPRRFLYVARYVEHKGIFEMWEAFVQLQRELPNDWELWCLGTGDQWGNRVKHEKIKHFGFVQPQELDEYIAQTGVYILPSKFEPWGVSVQEFAIAGFPLLLSTAIGASEQFLKKNGQGFEAGSVAEIKNAMKNIVEMEANNLVKMGEESHQIGMTYTTEDWAKRILALKEK